MTDFVLNKVYLSRFLYSVVVLFGQAVNRHCFPLIKNWWEQKILELGSIVWD